MRKIINYAGCFFLIATLVFTESCNCNDSKNEIPCPDCEAVKETCFEGTCICSDGYVEKWGYCIESSEQAKSRGLDAYIAFPDEGCYGFDSTTLKLGTGFEDRLLDDTSSQLVFADEVVILDKLNFEPVDNLPYSAIFTSQILEQGAVVRRLSDSLIHVQFVTGDSEPRACFDYNRSSKEFRFIWDCAFSEDMQFITAKITYCRDNNGDGYVDLDNERIDSCIMHYEKY